MEIGLKLDMNNTDSQRVNYFLAASLGAIGGGIFVLVATRALPRVMSQMMTGMMRNMMSQMGEEGCDPSEI